MNSSSIRRMGSSAIALLALSSSQAFAQAPAVSEHSPDQAKDNGQIQDITVTARRAKESLMSVPVAVSAISAAQIQHAGVTDLGQIAQMAPQVIVSRADSGAGASFTIRGIGTNFSDGGLEQSVAVNIDGVQASRGNFINQGFFDLAQVEVLKGPQALFFGKNSPAGVISLHSIDPTDHREGYVKTGYEFEAKERYAEAGIGGPLSDTLKARMALRYSKMDGWLNNTGQPFDTSTQAVGNPLGVPASFTSTPAAKSNGGEEFLGRVTLVYTPSKAFDATLKLSGGTYKDNGSIAEFYGCSTEHVTWTNGFFDPSSDCKLDGNYQRVNSNATISNTLPYGNDGVPYTKQTSGLGVLTMNYHLDDVTVTSVTGYYGYRFTQFTDFDYASYTFLPVTSHEDTRNFSQELRVSSAFDGPLNFTMGGFFEDNHRKSQVAAMYGYVGPDPVTGSYATDIINFNDKGKTASAFGQIKWKILTKLELTGGVRYTHENKSTAQVNAFINTYIAPYGIFMPQGVIVSGKESFSNYSPEATLSWKPTGDVLIYGAYKTGYKSGGFSNPALLSPASTATSLAFRPEKSSGFEIGTKLYLLDRRLRLEATAYTYLFKDLQYSTIEQTAAGSVYYVANAASASTRGVEASVNWRLTHELSVNLDTTYNVAHYVRFTTAKCYDIYQTVTQGCVGGLQDLSGRNLPRAPKTTLGVGLNYDTALASGWKIGVNADAHYTSSYDTLVELDPRTKQSGYTLFNAGLRLSTDDDKWEVAFIGRNLTDKRYKIISGQSPLLPSGTYWAIAPRPRELKLQLSYHF